MFSKTNYSKVHDHPTSRSSRSPLSPASGKEAKAPFQPDTSTHKSNKNEIPLHLRYRPQLERARPSTPTTSSKKLSLSKRLKPYISDVGFRMQRLCHKRQFKLNGRVILLCVFYATVVVLALGAMLFLYSMFLASSYSPIMEKKKLSSRLINKMMRKMANFHSLDQMDDMNYTTDFTSARIETNGKKKRNTPMSVLNWNYDQLSNNSITEHRFLLGSSPAAWRQNKEQISLHSPLCIDGNRQRVFTFSGHVHCSGSNGTDEFFATQCETNTNQASAVDFKWFYDHSTAHDIEWIDDLTIFQLYNYSQFNVLPFAKAMLLLHHVLHNIAAYALQPRNPANIIMHVDSSAVLRKLQAQESVQRHLLSAVISPNPFSIGTLDEFVHDHTQSKKTMRQKPTFFLLTNLSTKASSDGRKRYTCFKRALVPTSFHNRLFVSDFEYPSQKPSVHPRRRRQITPHIPRDALRFRSQLDPSTESTTETKPIQRQRVIALFDRSPSPSHTPSRQFTQIGRSRFVDVVSRTAQSRGYAFQVFDFANMSFTEQLAACSNVSIAVGVHGANLLNVVLMPVLGAVVELFPRGYASRDEEDHMFENGGNSGMRYFKWSAQSTSAEWSELYKYNYDMDRCVNENEDCRNYYMDTDIDIVEDDEEDIEETINEAIVWTESL